MVKKILAGIVVVISFLVFPRSALGFGITPAEISVENLTPGSHYEKDVYVVRPVDEMDETLQVVLELDLPEIEPWFKFVPGKEFTFPENKNTTTFKVVVDVPQDAQKKNYKGQITVKGVPATTAKEGVTILKGAVLGIDLTATDKKDTQLKVLSVNAPDVNSGDPVRILLTVQNEGNSAASPDKVVLDVMDLFEKPLENSEDSSLEKIDPFSTKEIEAQFDSELEKGQYRVDVSVLANGEEIKREKLILNVNARPERINEEPTMNLFGPINLNSDTGIMLTFVGLLLLVLILILLVKKRRKKESDIEKKLEKLIKENRQLTYVLIAISLLLIIGGLYLVIAPARLSQDKSGSILVTTPTPVPVDLTPTPTQVPDKSVRGVSIEAMESKVTPFIVKRPGKPGAYPLYEYQSFDAPILYEAEDGETFDVIEREGEWIKVFLQDGTSGWLHQTSIKKSQ